MKEIKILGKEWNLAEILMKNKIINNKTQYNRLRKPQLIEYLINLVLTLSNGNKKRFLINVDEQKEDTIEIHKNIKRNKEESEKNLNFLLKCSKIIKEEIISNDDLDLIMEDGFNEVFLSPQLRFNEDIINYLFEFFIKIKKESKNIFDLELNNKNISKNFKLKNIVSSLHNHFAEKVENLIDIFRSEEFLLIILIYYLYKKLREEVYKTYDCIELNEEDLSIFDEKFIEIIIIVYNFLNKSSQLDLNLENFEDLLNSFCDKGYKELELKFHPFPWTCY
ncbi:hypothetical protein LCGC14_0854570 [marine sediment metagenome]|uniref:Uncharacterized protein n=1 Tax=marine sediment metagenome TaxID=412755 RepID=A0A0F9PUI0_9ZZZZ